MKLSEIRGEKALDMTAELIDPIAEIMADAEVKKIYAGQPKLKLVQYIIKKHKKPIIKILAILNEEDPKTFADKIKITTLPAMVIDLLNDEELIQLFSLQGQTVDATSSGSVTENTEVKED